jgi:hypothetical protein
MRLFGAGPYHLLRCFQCLTHWLCVPFLTALSSVMPAGHFVPSPFPVRPFDPRASGLGLIGG